MPDGWSVDVDGEKVVVNFSVEGDYSHRVLSRHRARVLRTQLHLAYLFAGPNERTAEAGPSITRSDEDCRR
jgi:hypothetical protein